MVDIRGLYHINGDHFPVHYERPDQHDAVPVRAQGQADSVLRDLPRHGHVHKAADRDGLAVGLQQSRLDDCIGSHMSGACR